jgi:hypothetical protein
MRLKGSTFEALSGFVRRTFDRAAAHLDVTLFATR